MKCEYCKYKGCDVHQHGLKKDRCAFFIPITNEEWFASLTTEEKAKVIYKIAKDNFQELRKMFYLVANDDCDAIAMWLKEVHE